MTIKNINLDLQFHPRKEIVAEPEEESEKKSSQGKYEKEDTNKEESVLCEIKIAGMEEPAVKIVTKTSDNLEMAELNPDPVPNADQDEEGREK